MSDQSIPPAPPPQSYPAQQQPYGPAAGQYGYPPQQLPYNAPPQGAYAPVSAEGGAREIIPPNVVTAFRLMIIAAIVEFAQILVNIGWSTSIANDVNSAAQSAQGQSTFGLPGVDVVGVDTGKYWGIGLGAVALWVVMALVIRTGSRGGRITGTVLFGLSPIASIIYVIGLNGNKSSAQQIAGVTVNNLPSVALPAIPQVVTFVLGLIVVTLVWRGSTSGYFRSQVATRAARGVTPGYGYPPAQQPPVAFPTPTPWRNPSAYPPPAPRPDTVPPNTWGAPPPPST